MTFDTERDRVGREPVTIVEIDLDKCANDFAGTFASTPSGTCEAKNTDSVELVTDGDMPSTANWTAINANTSLSIVSGALRITSVANGASGVWQAIPCEIGKRYFVSTDFVTDNSTGDNYIYIGSTAVAADTLSIDCSSATGVYEKYFIATHAIHYISLINATAALAADYSDWDDVSIQLLTPCYNTRKTCVDPDNYDNTAITTYKFSDRDIDGENYMPCIVSNTLSPIAITPGQPFNKRASISIILQDFAHHDRGIDPYVASRSYTPEDQGTFFGKLIARNPFYQGRPLRLITGYVDASGTLQTQTENYILEEITFGKKGQVMIVAKDILKLADDERSFAPAASTGNLEASITAGAVSLTVTSGTEGEYNAESDFIRIGDEVIEAPAANRSANVFSNLTRGAWNTTAASHDLDDSVQACLHYDATNVRDIIDDLLVNYAGISSSYITAADWDAEKDKWLAGHNLTALITDPTGVNTLLDEISEEIMVYIWWDAVNQKIRLKAIAPPDETLITLNEDDHIVGEVDISIEAEDRKTRVLLFYNPRTPLAFGKATDFKSFYGNIDAGEESADKNNDIRQKIIYSRWITGDSVAATTASRTVNQFRETPKVMKFLVDAKEMADNAIGDYINIETRRAQAFDGSNDATLVQILSIEEMTQKAPGTQYKLTVQQAQFSGRYARIMSASDQSVYSSASDAEKAKGCYIVAAGATYFPDGGEAYKIP